MRTSARVNAVRLCEKWDVKGEKTVSENRLNFLPNIKNLFSGIHRSCFGRSELLYRQLRLKLNPSLKFLSSHNSLRNFFSPSRDEIKMFLLIKPKIFFIFLNNSNRKRFCLFASWHLCFSKQAPPKYFNNSSWLPPPRWLFSNQIFSYFRPFFMIINTLSEHKPF